VLTRIYIDNFRCFVKFEHKPARRELLIGGNGTGKSSLVDALFYLRQIVVAEQDFLERLFLQRTRWLNQLGATFELEARLEEEVYIYRLVVGPWGEPPRPRVVEEVLLLEGKPIFEFQEGEVHLFNDQSVRNVVYPFDWARSALATVVPRKENQKLTKFKRWLAGLLCFRINPFSILPRADGEHRAPNLDLSDLAAWYRHLVQVDPMHVDGLNTGLREVLSGFKFLRLEPYGENVRLLKAVFSAVGETDREFYFNELSEGQRCLIALYTVLHFVLSAHGGTVIFDEPDNFISLREIQPWLTALEDAVEQRGAQVLIVSHHPEVIDFWAPENRVLFVRDATGAARIEPIPAQPDSPLTLSELIARGWERE
jgi:predicted ATPase